jgi:Flp pilus assembly pilin Flp
MPFRRGARLADDSGQGLVEYTLVLALASLGMMLALVILQNSTAGAMRATSRPRAAAPAGTPAGPLLPGARAGTETGDRARIRRK